MLNKMLSDRKKGIEVVMAFCDRAMPSCITNIRGNSGICTVCRHMQRQMIKNYLPDIKVIAVSEAENLLVKFHPPRGYISTRYYPLFVGSWTMPMT